MKFNMTDIVSKEHLVDVEVPAYLTNPGEWSVIYNAITMAQNGRRGTAAKQILAAIERIRKEAMEDSVQGRVEAYLIGHKEGWGEACEVEEGNNQLKPRSRAGDEDKPPYRSDTPIADANKAWEDRSSEEKAALRQSVAEHIDLTVKIDNEYRMPGVTAIAKEVIDGPQS